MIEEFKTFIAVVDYNNFTKAAEMLNLSQPAVSRHIKNLEDIYGITLIERSYKEKKISITPCGKHLYNRAKEILGSLRDISYEMECFKEEVTGTIKIGASYTIGEFFVPKFLRKFSDIYPKAEIDITIDNTQEICTKVNNGLLDIGLVEGNFEENEFLYGEFEEDELILAVPKGYTNGRISFRKNDFNNAVWISREEGSGTREVLEGFLSDYKIFPKKIVVFGSNYSIKEAVRYGLGVTLISEKVLKEAIELNEIDIIKLKKRYNRKFRYILKHSKVHSIISNIIVKMLSSREKI